MFLNDLPLIFTWWSILFFLGAVLFPLTSRLFKPFLDKGYIFAKVLGILIVSYLMWIASTIHLAVFSQANLIIILLILVSANLFFLFFERSEKFKYSASSSRPPKADSNNKKSLIFFILLEEVIFTVCLLFWAFVKGHQPDLIGLEKFMDFGFINSLLRTKYFPPLDMWLSQSPTYSGHFIVKLFHGLIVGMLYLLI